MNYASESPSHPKMVDKTRTYVCTYKCLHTVVIVCDNTANDPGQTGAHECVWQFVTAASKKLRNHKSLSLTESLGGIYVHNSEHIPLYMHNVLMYVL